MSTDEELFAQYNQFFAQPVVAQGVVTPPLLAHYTSIQVMESIIQTNQIWFSNPLFMNDLQEVRFGLLEGARIFSDASRLKKAAGDDNRSAILNRFFAQYLSEFDSKDAFDTYVFCLSEHDKANTDGVLSMWRGYGQHGNGVALVFDPTAVTVVPTSPLIISKVEYGSDEERRSKLEMLLDRWAEVTAQTGLSDDKLYLAAAAAFQAVRAFSLVSKHSGFSEEAEWRVIYYPERDRAGLLRDFMTYHIGERGVEPKLKYVIGHLANVSAPDLTLERLLERIILGPSLSYPLARRSVERMLEKIGKPQFKTKLYSSRIPLRPPSGGSF